MEPIYKFYKMYHEIFPLLYHLLALIHLMSEANGKDKSENTEKLVHVWLESSFTYHLNSNLIQISRVRISL